MHVLHLSCLHDLFFFHPVVHQFTDSASLPLFARVVQMNGAVPVTVRLSLVGADGALCPARSFGAWNQWADYQVPLDSKLKVATAHGAFFLDIASYLKTMPSPAAPGESVVVLRPPVVFVPDSPLQAPAPAPDSKVPLLEMPDSAVAAGNKIPSHYPRAARTLAEAIAAVSQKEAEALPVRIEDDDERQAALVASSAAEAALRAEDRPPVPPPPAPLLPAKNLQPSDLLDPRKSLVACKYGMKCSVVACMAFHGETAHIDRRHLSPDELSRNSAMTCAPALAGACDMVACSFRHYTRIREPSPAQLFHIQHFLAHQKRLKRGMCDEPAVEGRDSAFRLSQCLSLSSELRHQQQPAKTKLSPWASPFICNAQRMAASKNSQK